MLNEIEVLRFTHHSVHSLQFLIKSYFHMDLGRRLPAIHTVHVAFEWGHTVVLSRRSRMLPLNFFGTLKLPLNIAFLPMVASSLSEKPV